MTEPTLYRAHQITEVTSETLMKTSFAWDGSPYMSYPKGRPEMSVLKIIIPPHTGLEWHTHPVPSVGFVLSGRITVEKRLDGSRKTICTGEVLPETVETAHRGFTDEEPTTLIVFYAGAEGLPLVELLK